VVEQTLSNWVKAKRKGRLKVVSGRLGVAAERMEINQLRAELAQVKMWCDILGTASAYFTKGQKRSTPSLNAVDESGLFACSAGC